MFLLVENDNCRLKGRCFTGHRSHGKVNMWQLYRNVEIFLREIEMK